MIDMSISDCKGCGAHTNYVHTSDDATGQVFKFDLCVYCEDEVFSLMSEQERLQSLCRITFEDRR
jgi:hypothetical protein